MVKEVRIAKENIQRSENSQRTNKKVKRSDCSIAHDVSPVVMFLLYEEKSTVSSNKQTAKSFSFYSFRLLYRRTITFFGFYQSLIDPSFWNIIYSFSVCEEFYSIV